MKTFKKLSVIAVLAGLVHASNVSAQVIDPSSQLTMQTSNVSAQAFTPITPEQFANNILDNLKSKILSKVQGRLTSVLMSAIFGFGSNNSGALSETALQQIRQVIRDAIINADTHESQALLEALNLSLNNYHESAKLGIFDHVMLSNLVSDSHKLTTHRVFSKSYNSQFFMNTKIYMMVSSLAIAIYTEQFLQERVSKAYISSRAKEYATALERMKNEAIHYVHSNVYMVSCGPYEYVVRCEYWNGLRKTPGYYKEEFAESDYADGLPILHEQQIRDVYIQTLIEGIDSSILKLKTL
ncbi:hypothetical protein Rhein_2774 [Rheinheimera sp. A13L]|uniref:hypothetical protein n=1 Tax=Rheinheimera sp. A13L TaxID=506534 RepID=UPI0002124C1F|nr:hypothetical protein [Rheinheimera sp. A13L]EGM77146.1 hypothetical protein Rhein_2774 [Rheinheimera sp. A13L]